MHPSICWAPQLHFIYQDAREKEREREENPPLQKLNIHFFFALMREEVGRRQHASRYYNPNITSVSLVFFKSCNLMAAERRLKIFMNKMHSFSWHSSTRAVLSANWPCLDWITKYFIHFIAPRWALDSQPCWGNFFRLKFSIKRTYYQKQFRPCLYLLEIK